MLEDWQIAALVCVALVGFWVALFVYVVRLRRVEAKRSAVNTALQLEVGLVAAVAELPAQPSAYKVRQARTIARHTALVPVDDVLAHLVPLSAEMPDGSAEVSS